MSLKEILGNNPGNVEDYVKAFGSPRYVKQNDVYVPGNVNGKTKIFYNKKLYQALQDCLDEDYKPLYMPELADRRINLNEDDEIWNNWFIAPSVRVTGRTKQGNAVVVYAHIPNYFSNPENIKNALGNLRNGAGSMPQEEFYNLLNQEDNERVFVIDYSDLKNSSNGMIKVDKALEHPQTIPFLGGRGRAEQYLEKFRKIKGDKIGIYYSNDLDDTARGRLLFLYSSRSGLDGDYDLDYIGRFLRVAAEPQE
ncbi:MAG: hypothetical protein ABIF40_04635 [archaeon]